MLVLHLAEASTVVTLITLAVALAAGATSYVLARRARKPHANTALEDNSLSNVATQGAFVPLLIGKRRVGAVVGWVGDRETIHLSTTEKKNKGLLFHAAVQHFDQTKRVPTGQVLYSEAAWHLLCVGPAIKIHRIWAGGELIFPDANSGYSNPLDSTTHPSGTMIAVGAGEFVVYWGEPDQPTNTFLSDSNRVGVLSRWPHMCYVEWTRFGLQSSPAWPQLEYEVEVQPYITAIDADDYIDKWKDAGDYEGANLGMAFAQIMFESYPHGINLAVADFDYTASAGGGGAEALSRIYTLPTTVYTNGPQNFVGNPTGTPASTDAGTYDLTHGPPYYDGGGMEDGTNWAGVYLVEGYESGYIDRLYVYLRGPSAQQVSLYDEEVGDLYDGSSFGTYAPPSGWDFDADLGLAYVPFEVSTAVLDETGVWELYIYLEVTFDNNPNERLDAAGQVTLYTQASDPTGSVYEFIELMDTEAQVGSVIARDGDEAETAIGSILQDAGAFMPFMCNGKLGIVPLREVDSADVIDVDQDQVLPPAAEIEVIHADKHVDRVMFSFSDQARNYRETVIQVDEDGQPARTGAPRGQVLGLNTVVDFDVASFVAERRSQEELGRGARFLFNLARGWHRVLPGRVISVPDVEQVLRVVSVQLNPASDKAEVECLVDFYGAEASSYTHTEYDKSGTVNLPAAANLQETYFEVPEHAGERGQVLVVPLRVRAGAQVLNQLIHLSNDGTSYDLEGAAGGAVAGGTLDDAIAASTDWVIDTGPELTLLGVDDDLLDHFSDLTTDEAAWRSGRQLALINDELFYVKKVTAVSGSTYRLDGLIRARLDTQMEAHSINDEVYLFTLYNSDTFGGPKVYPGATLYMKQQPLSIVGPLSLASVTATNKTLTGKGVRPMRPGGLRVTSPNVCVPAYSTGEAVTFRWCYRSSELAGTGAGLQAFGAATGVSAIQGEFEVEVYDTGDTLVATYDVGAVEEWTYSNANIQSDLGGEVSFYVLLRNVNGSLRSDSVRLDVEKL